MTISLQNPFIIYTANGVTLEFAYSFRILEASHLKVAVAGVLQTTGFTVSGVDNPGGGVVTFNVAPLPGEEVLLFRQVTRDQLVDYQPFDAFPAETHERALDKLTMMAQEDANLTLRAVRVFPQDVVRNLLLPLAAARANGILSFDADGNVIVVPSIGGTIVHAQLQGLAADDHLQYHTDTRGDLRYLALTGGTLAGALTLSGPPTVALHAATKAYVDTSILAVDAIYFQSDATGDAQLTVQAAWNAQANLNGYVRAPNEILFYRWPSTLQNAYRYIGSQQGPAGWASVQAEWLQTTGIAEAPNDGQLYGRQNLNWAVIPPSVAEAPADNLYYVRRNGVWIDSAADINAKAAVISNAGIAAHVALANPHPVYLLNATAVSTYVPLTQKGSASGVAALDSNAKVAIASLYAGVASGLATLDAGTKVPIAQLPAGTANGLATLDGAGTVPLAQIPLTVATDAEVSTALTNHVAAADPHTQYQREAEKGVANGYASLDGAGLVPLAQLPSSGATVGRVVQVIEHTRGDSITGNVILPLDDTIPQNTEGTEVLSVTITPLQANSRIRINAKVHLSHALGAGITTGFVVALFRGAIAGALVAGTSSAVTDAIVDPEVSLEIPGGLGGLTPVTFTIRVGMTPAGSWRLNGVVGTRRLGGVLASYLKVEELSA